MLNDKSGVQLPTEVRKDPAIAHIPILMTAAINKGRTGEKFSPGTEDEKLPVDGFMNKPARPEELYRRVGMPLDMKISKWARRFSS